MKKSTIIVLLIFCLCSCGGSGNDKNGDDQFTNSNSNQPSIETEQAFNAQTELVGDAFYQFFIDCNTIGKEAARGALMDHLQGDPNIIETAIMVDDETVKIEFVSGPPAYLFLTKSDIEPIDLNSILEQIENQNLRFHSRLFSPEYDVKPKALVIWPYAFPSKIFLEEDDKRLYSELETYLENALTDIGYNPNMQVNHDLGKGDVNIGDFEDWSEYRIVVVLTHGNPELICAGITLLDYEGYKTYFYNYFYGYGCFKCMDPESLRGIGLYRRPVFSICLTKNFFKKTRCQCGSLVVFAACHSGDDKWVNTLTNAGAEVYVGCKGVFNNLQYLSDIFDELGNNKTIGEALAGSIWHSGPADNLDWHLGHFVGGSWDAVETVTVTATLNGITNSQSFRNSGLITVEQNGCKIRWLANVLGSEISTEPKIKKHTIELPSIMLENPIPGKMTGAGLLSEDHNTIELSLTNGAEQDLAIYMTYHVQMTRTQSSYLRGVREKFLFQ